MPLTRVRASKNLPLRHYEAETAIDNAADRVRARFATPNMHQIYSDKRNEPERYVTALAGGETPDLADYPYLSKEIGVTAPSAESLAQLWLFMDSQWKQVAAVIEQIRVGSKAQVRTATSADEIDAIVAQTTAILDTIGDKPPQRPKPTATA